MSQWPYQSWQNQYSKPAYPAYGASSKQDSQNGPGLPSSKTNPHPLTSADFDSNLNYQPIHLSQRPPTQTHPLQIPHTTSPRPGGSLLGQPASEYPETQAIPPIQQHLGHRQGGDNSGLRHVPISGHQIPSYMQVPVQGYAIPPDLAGGPGSAAPGSAGPNPAMYPNGPPALGHAAPGSNFHMPQEQWDLFALGVRQPQSIESRGQDGSIDSSYDDDNSDAPSKLRSSSTSQKVTKRSRMGCLTCRQRKKRCCESRPRCKECQRLRLNCVWPKPGTEHKNKPKEVKSQENMIDHDVYGKIKVLRGIVEYRLA